MLITDAERADVATINGRVRYTDIVNDLTTGGTSVPLSAEQGKALKAETTAINVILQSNDTDLDVLQEVVTYIKANRTTLTSLGISSISGLQAALDGKDATVSGKGLSTNDFTESKSRLSIHYSSFFLPKNAGINCFKNLSLLASINKICIITGNATKQSK